MAGRETVKSKVASAQPPDETSPGVALSIISLVFASVALAVTLTGLRRRPRIVAEWGYVAEQPGAEGLSVIITARRRPIEVDEVGLVVLPKRIISRQVPEWLHLELPYRVPLSAGNFHQNRRFPVPLSDGESVRAFGQLDVMIDALDGRDKDHQLYVYVLASGTAYLARDKTFLRKLRPRVGEG